MDCFNHKRVDWMFFLFTIMIPREGQACSTTTGITSPWECGTKPTHICQASTHYEDLILSNHTLWACLNNGVTSIRCTPNCCANDNIIEGGIVLMPGIRTEVACSMSTPNPTSPYKHTLGILGPPGSRVLVSIRGGDPYNVIRATDGQNIDHAYFFNTDGFVAEGDYFLSESNEVNLQAILTNSAQAPDVVVISQSFDIIDTITAPPTSLLCVVSPPVTGLNQWHTACEDGSHSSDDSCYKFSSDNMDFQRARENCEAMGYHLVYITTSEEQDFLVSFLVTRSPREHWIGIERDSNGDPVWMDGSPITYSCFGANDGGRDCFQIRQQENYAWEDHQCDHRHAFICERELGYHGYSASDGGCVSYGGTLPATIGAEGAILLKFSYTIKTNQVLPSISGLQRTTSVSSGNCVTTCQATNEPFVSQNGLQLKISCSSSFASSRSWTVTFQARGAGMVQISDFQLLIYNETESPPSSTPSTRLYTTRTRRIYTGRDVPDGNMPTTSTTKTNSTSPMPSNLSTPEHTTASPVDVSPKGSSSILYIAVPLLLAFILIFMIIGAVWFVKKRRSSSADHKSSSAHQSVEVREIHTYSNDEHEYTTSMDSVKRSSNQANYSEVLDDVNQHEYTEMPSGGSSKPGNRAIYNEVGDEEYNVLFGGKETKDYHVYNMPGSVKRDSGDTNPGRMDKKGGGRENRKQSQELVDDKGNNTRICDNTYQDLDNTNDGPYPMSLKLSADSATESTKVPSLGLQSTTITDHTYQDLHETDGEGYTPLNLTIKSGSQLTKTTKSAPLRGSNATEQSPLSVNCPVIETAKRDGDGQSFLYTDPSEYDDPIFKPDDESYDNLQHTPLTGISNSQSTAKDSIVIGDDEYLTPNAGHTYQTLGDSVTTEPDGEGVTYSHLQRGAHKDPLPDERYGKLHDKQRKSR
ncbi:uncharacterized protein LOC121431404 [Lytechinus variegatus]|uniref:uncharacterized protein LOC121431404 n=1 Tax=Lytechinus variegatus TaxID=7654 RepID=UPI001BB1FA80|nr:uncharacterized protein LOC121431404 [Lytechinus variegatus]